LITGATGFVGRHAVASFERARISIRPAVRSDAPPGGVAIGDLSGQVNWRDALDGVDTVVHLAARVHVMQKMSSAAISQYRAINRDATLALARAAASARVKRLVFVSTIKVTGDRSDHPVRPEDPPHPRDPYSVSKWEAETGLRAIERETGLEVVIVRPPLVYGPGVGGNLARLLRLVRRGVPLPLGAVRNRRTMIAVRNLADLLVVSAIHPRAAGQLILAGDAESVSTPELLDMLAAGLGVRARIWSMPVGLLRLAGRLAGRREEVARLTDSLEVDITRTRTLLDWRPPVSMHDGIGEMARAWIQK
jgi:nucleoside-diphosphate-sugar epimerase